MNMHNLYYNNLHYIILIIKQNNIQTNISIQNKFINNIYIYIKYIL